MAFDKIQVQKMQDILKHLEPTTIESVQTYNISQKFRINATFGIKDKTGKYNYIFQFYKSLSNARLKILERRKKTIPFELHIKEFDNDFVCIGWKYKN